MSDYPTVRYFGDYRDEWGDRRVWKRTYMEHAEGDYALVPVADLGHVLPRCEECGGDGIHPADAHGGCSHEYCGDPRPCPICHGSGIAGDWRWLCERDAPSCQEWGKPYPSHAECGWRLIVTPR